MDKIREAFMRIKEDILSLRKEIAYLKEEINKIKEIFNEIEEKTINSSFHQKNPTQLEVIPTIVQQKLPKEALNRLNFEVSTGNKGVPTDRQTNQQTDRHINNVDNLLPITTNIQQNINVKEENHEEFNEFEEAIKILDSLDRIKKEIRKKFKRLTNQEFKVFVTIYSLENRGISVDYKLLSKQLNLSESSVRDYVGKLINKGIPILKEKINNKQVLLHIDRELKKLASLETIIKLREL